ncbi:nuclear transport factor 2 family protein [Mycolicibacterium confluentis]|uniref:Bile-acid 7-alpha-dehydratase n=1 Tax=Mycolicibacterium confluentis TaxID=28047 RepID=A0A7I7Y407_9MYCO|nr:nuclear transport factor 2 family protein [Mycolicibacterium confluentis]MCV7322710.1 nuclear transport factor 2 family protein [Mycolicibacterium confluentis]ORV29763.1 hypothetical protein AWB99_16425 [Mycolicibacterium confluentis]BBZ36388.1 bile-acid 7-alpha-dehydratase [Mycolicibacterium confluentis]
MSDPTEPTTWDEIEAVRQLKARYFRHLDTKDWEAWRDLFADDVVGTFDNAVATEGADAAGQTWVGVDELVTSIRGVLEGCTTVHHGHTPEIVLESPTTATGIWAMADIVDFPGGHTLTGAGHYHETYTKTAGQWRIQSIHLTRTRMAFTQAEGAHAHLG